MRIAGNIPYRRRPAEPDAARSSRNNASHWWDGSEVYGADAAKASQLREGAKLRLTPEGYLPEDVNGFEITGFNESWWLGLSSLHTLFAREHNLLCDELRAHYRGLERRARLPDGAADRLRADRQDPHGRVDAGDPRHRGHRHRPQGQLERPAGARLADPARASG